MNPSSGVDSVRRGVDGAGLVLLLGAVAWAPVPLASNRPWSMALLAALVWLALMLGLAAAVARPERELAKSLARAGRAWLPLLLGAAFCGLVVLQLAWRAPMGEPPLTMDPFQTRDFLLRALLYVGALAAAALLVRTRERCTAVLTALFAAGLVQAVVAVVLYSAGRQYVYMFEAFDQGSRATGTFVNPDHLAGFMEITIAAGVGLLLSQMGGRAGEPSWRQRLADLLRFVMSRKMLARLALVVPVLVLVMTHSRAGNGAVFVALVVVGGLVALVSRQLRRPALWLVASMLVVDIFVIAQWVGLERVVDRLKATAEASSITVASFGLDEAPPPPREQSIAERLEVPRLSLQLVADKPWLGHGGGTFDLAFAPIKPETTYAGFWTHAHNDYVQVAVETGLVGALMWVGIGLVAAWRALGLLKDGQPRLNRGVGVAALLAISCLALHSVVDFNLYIPANALALTVLLSLVFVVDGLPSRRRRHGHADEAE
jgi:O-antigen ligase